MFEKNLRLSVLFDAYGALLTPDQQNMFDLYYNEDLSLAEIAEHAHLSRQGVRYAIKHAEEALLSYEERLGLVRKTTLLNQKLSEAESILKELEPKHNDESKDFERLLALISGAGSIMKE